MRERGFWDLSRDCYSNLSTRTEDVERDLLGRSPPSVPDKDYEGGNINNYYNMDAEELRWWKKAAEKPVSPNPRKKKRSRRHGLTDYLRETLSQKGWVKRNTLLHKGWGETSIPNAIAKLKRDGMPIESDNNRGNVVYRIRIPEQIALENAKEELVTEVVSTHEETPCSHECETCRELRKHNEFLENIINKLLSK